jgi:hypothetical protein
MHRASPGEWAERSGYRNNRKRRFIVFNEMTGDGFDPRKARGFIDVQALHMWASERARHQRPAGSA